VRLVDDQGEVLLLAFADVRHEGLELAAALTLGLAEGDAEVIENAGVELGGREAAVSEVDDGRGTFVAAGEKQAKSGGLAGAGVAGDQGDAVKSAGER
jgi:hypothetical protein